MHVLKGASSAKRGALIATRGIPAGTLTACLLVERQIDAAHRWRYEWAVLSYAGVIALVAADAVLGRGVDLLTLLGVAVLGASGYRLARAEQRAFYLLLKVYSELDGRWLRWPGKWEF